MLSFVLVVSSDPKCAHTVRIRKFFQNQSEKMFSEEYPDSERARELWEKARSGQKFGSRLNVGEPLLLILNFSEVLWACVEPDNNLLLKVLGIVKRGGKKKKGFAAIDSEKQKKIAQMGGIAVQKNSHRNWFNKEKAREAGRKGLISRGCKLPSETEDFAGDGVSGD